jgi:site-specific recombinase XerD/transposase-like protein
MSKNAEPTIAARPHPVLRTVALPDLIRRSGEPAVRAYRSLLDDPALAPKTSYNYERQIARFCAWAEGRGLSLEAITAAEIAAFAESVEARNGSWISAGYLTGVRRFLGCLMDAGLFDHNPCGASLPELRWAAEDQAEPELRHAEMPDDPPATSSARIESRPSDDETGEVALAALDAIPDIIRAAGDAAVTAYREFLDNPKWSRSTKRAYSKSIRRFLCWAAYRNLSLEAIAAADLTVYAAEIAARSSLHAASVSLSGIRGLLRHLAAAGVLATNPCQSPSPKLQEPYAKDTSSQPQSTPKPEPVGFRLLDLLAMLGHMEEQTLDAIFNEETLALALLEQVRWPNGPECPYCGSSADDDPQTEVICPACAKHYSVTTGTMFDGSPVPVRVWFIVIHQAYLAQSGLHDKQLRQLGLDLPTVLSVCRRIGEALMQDALPIGDELRRAITVRDRELGQDQVVRSIIEYAELTAARDRLLQARADGTPVADLPPGMTLDEAIEKVESRIAEYDRYLITVEDGYLVRDPAEMGAAAGQPTAPSTPTAEAQDSSDARIAAG